MGKKNNNQDDKPSRKDLVREIERLRAHNEELQARLERIAEIANASVDAGESDAFELKGKKS